MPRIRAGDYKEKKSKILDAAASLFADQGYTGSRMEEIAKACGVSKSMLYHYFKRKEDVLFDILQEHVSDLIEAIKNHTVSGNREDPFDYFRGFVEVYLQPTGESRARHVVALHDMRYLTDEQKAKQIKLERELLELVEKILEEIRGGSTRSDYRISAFLLIGMLNWVELWYRRTGRISPSEFYQKITTLFLTGFLEGKDGEKLTKGLSDFMDPPTRASGKRKARIA
jgi:AcrR family transcriptional regulator